jgi:hypothetical protein
LEYSSNDQQGFYWCKETIFFGKNLRSLKACYVSLSQIMTLALILIRIKQISKNSLEKGEKL